MSKKRRQQIREEKRKDELKRWLPDWNTLKKFLGIHSLAILGIVVPVLAGFVIYYLSTTEPDIRFITVIDVEKVDVRESRRTGMTYYTSVLRYRNFSFKSGYVDKVEFTPASLSPALSVKVLEVEKVKIGWREDKDIQIKYVVSVDADAATEEYKRNSPQTVILDMRAYDNTGKLLLDVIGGTETARLNTTIDFPKGIPPPSPTVTPPRQTKSVK